MTSGSVSRWLSDATSAFTALFSDGGSEPAVAVVASHVASAGVVAYHGLAVAVVCPKAVETIMSSVGIKKDPLNVLLATSVSGLAVNLFDRKHMRSYPKHTRALYSAFISSLAVFGSVLAWAMLSRSLSSSTSGSAARLVCALASASAALYACNRHLAHIDHHHHVYHQAKNK